MKYQQLIDRAIKIINFNPKVFQTIYQELNLSEKTIIDAFVYYNSKVEEIDNDVYASLGIRVAMFIEYLTEKSWHQERQDTLIYFLKYCQSKSIIDVGFGTPMKYIKDYISDKTDLKLTLAEKYDSAFQFAKVILKCWGFEKDNRINFKKIDLNKPTLLGKFDTYIFQDSIEHAIDPKTYLEMNITQSPSEAKFIFSLPVAPMIPCHYISWQTAKEVVKWVESFDLKVIEQRQIFVNPEVDDFAKNLGEISNLMLITEKGT